MAASGRVFIVGAGPGDPGLLTVRALELIASADAILYDRLIPTSALREARPDALLEYAGKEHSGDSAKQATIEQRMIELAHAGKLVVRLKGGDPLVFGRGGEEAAALADAEIDFEIVPGVTAGVAASAYAGIPVTHREHSAAVAFVTGHEDPSKTESALDWPALAAFPGTLVFYMGVKNLPLICARLLAGGRSADEPVAVIERGTTAVQRTMVGTLATIADLVAEARINPPALAVVGDVVAQREQIAWFEKRPLLGRSVVITRTRAQASNLAQQLGVLGAEVIETPTLSTEQIDDQAVQQAIAALGSYDAVAFTSAAGVESFFAALARSGRDTRALAGVELAAVGRVTAGALAQYGITADHLALQQSGAGLLDLLAPSEPENKRFLLAVAAQPNPTLADGLRKLGAKVEQVAFYATKPLSLSHEQLEAIARAEFITFASGSAVHSLVSCAGGTLPLESAACVSIGPTTSAALREHGIEPAAEAGQHDVEGLVLALLELARSAAQRP